MTKKRERGDYFKRRRAKLAAEREELEAKTTPPAGKQLSETLLVRVSGDMLAVIDDARRDGLIEVSRSEYVSNVLIERLGSAQPLCDRAGLRGGGPGHDLGGDDRSA